MTTPLSHIFMVPFGQITGSHPLMWHSDSFAPAFGRYIFLFLFLIFCRLSYTTTGTMLDYSGSGFCVPNSELFPTTGREKCVDI